jgi:hypothetical protein
MVYRGPIDPIIALLENNIKSVRFINGSMFYFSPCSLRYALCPVPYGAGLSVAYPDLWHHFKIPLRGRVLRMFGVSSHPRLATATPKLIIHI